MKFDQLKEAIDEMMAGSMGEKVSDALENGQPLAAALKGFSVNERLLVAAQLKLMAKFIKKVASEIEHFDLDEMFESH